MSLYLPLVKRRLSRYLFFTIPLPSAPLPALDPHPTRCIPYPSQPFTLPNLYLFCQPFTLPWRAFECIYAAYLYTLTHNYARRRPLLNLDHSFAIPLLSARASTFEHVFDYARA